MRGVEEPLIFKINEFSHSLMTCWIALSLELRNHRYLPYPKPRNFRYVPFIEPESAAPTVDVTAPPNGNRRASLAIDKFSFLSWFCFQHEQSNA